MYFLRSSKREVSGADTNTIATTGSLSKQVPLSGSLVVEVVVEVAAVVGGGGGGINREKKSGQVM